ncbi:MAG: redoxin domain-containing protein [Bacteroidota bacterium]
MTAQDLRPHTIRAHELYGDFWFNSEPVPIAALRGRVIVIHFWDYTCAHSLRSIPYIKEWSKKYEQHGLVVVGVHTPKFPFGKNPEEVHKAVTRLGITYPVVMDNEAEIASKYGSRVWPSLYVIDKSGYVRFQNFGEGNSQAIEHAIQTLLYDAGVDEELPLLMEPLRDEDRTGAVCYRVTPELFTGYVRGTLGNVEGYSPESVVEYLDPMLYLDGRFYAGGNWMNDRNSLRLAPDGDKSGHIVLKYQALEVNAVIKPEGDSGFEVVVTQDDMPLSEASKGDDVTIGEDGRSYLTIRDAKMFSVVRNKEFGEHVLKLSAKSGGFALYSLTFVSCVIPELVSNN